MFRFDRNSQLYAYSKRIYLRFLLGCFLFDDLNNNCEHIKYAIANLFMFAVLLV